MLTGLRDGDEVLRARRDGRPLALVVLHGVGADAVKGEPGREVAGEELSQLPEKWIQDGGKPSDKTDFATWSGQTENSTQQKPAS